MKSKGHDPAFPCVDTHPMTESYSLELVSSGLSKREYFAALALQGLLANPEFFHASDHRLLPKKAIEAADGLIDLLDQS